MFSSVRLPLPRVLSQAAPRRAYCYHGVVSERRDHRLERNLHLTADFREHVRILRRERVVALSVLADEMRSNRAPRVPATVITFDDGYANNLLAAEILSEAGLPWSVFVSTGAVGASGAIWTVELSLLILHGRREKVEALGEVWPLQTRAEREAAFQAIRYPMKVLPAASRREAMDGIRRQFQAEETQRLLDEFPAFRMLSWREVAGLSQAGVEIGSHGVEHEIHHASQEPWLRERELAESKREIEARLGKPCRFFAFPNGDSCEESAREVEAAGYELAFTTRPGVIGPNDNRFLLPRVSPGDRAAKLKEQLRKLAAA